MFNITGTKSRVFEFNFRFDHINVKLFFENNTIVFEFSRDSKNRGFRGSIARNSGGGGGEEIEEVGQRERNDCAGKPGHLIHHRAKNKLRPEKDFPRGEKRSAD